MMQISVLGAGMVTPVGFNFNSSGAAIRAGISGVRQANLWDAENGEYLLAGKVNLPQWWEGIGKLADLVAPAIWECFEAAKPEPPSRIPILLGIAPHDRPSRLPHLDEEILDEVEWRLDVGHHPRSVVIPMGNISGAIGIQHAEEILARSHANFCIVAGVDSFLQQEVVEDYMKHRRILTKTNSNGFYPGEAGCAVLVGPTGVTSKDELSLKGLALGATEPDANSDQPSRGTILTQLVRDALSQAGIRYEDTFYRNTDLNGEHSKFKEAAFIAGRIQRHRVPHIHELLHPIEYMGEVGAAIVPCVVALNLYYGDTGGGPGPRSICHFANDSGERAALVAEHHRRN